MKQERKDGKKLSPIQQVGQCLSQKMNTGTLLDLRMVARNDPGSYPYDGELYAITARKLSKARDWKSASPTCCPRASYI
jgi:hypothetical protein